MMQNWLKRRSESGESASALSKGATLDSLRYVVLDTELTSLDHRTNRLLSIGAIAMQGPSIRLGEQFYRVVNPEVTIPPETVVIHRLRSEDVAGAGQLEETLREFRKFVEGSVLVGHFVEIDSKVLQKEMKQTGHLLENPAVDTARVHRWILRHGPYSEDLSMQLEKLDLPTVAKFYHVDAGDIHHALADAFRTARVWQKMLAMLQAKGIGDLGKLLRIAKG